MWETLTSFSAAGALYGLLALDHIAAGHFMLSRPLIVGPLLGWLLGDPFLGLAAGMIIELLWVNVIPVGIWPVDTTSMAALAVTWTLSSSSPGRPAMVLALALALPAGMLVRFIDISLRRRSHRFTPWIHREIERGREGVLPRAVGLGLLLWWGKAWGIFVLLSLVGLPVLDAVLVRCPDRLLNALDFAGRVLPLLGVGAVLNYFLSRRKGTWPWQMS